MALVRVIDNQSGAETTVDEAWLTRWPGDYTKLSDDHVPLVEQERRRAEASGEPDEDPDAAPATSKKPSTRR